MNEQENIFKNAIGEDNFVDKETGEVIEKPRKEERELVEREANAVTINGYSLLNMGKDAESVYKGVELMAKAQNVDLNPKIKGSIFRNLQAVDKAVKEKGLSFTNKVFDDTLKALPYDLLNLSLLGLQFDKNELWLEIRKKKDSSLKTIKAKLQYQGLEQIMKNCYHDKENNRHIVKFFSDVICSDDEFQAYNDLENGSRVITKHIYGKSDRNKLENITGAYYIIYLENSKGEKSKIYIEIDKGRIERAKAASSTNTSGPWFSDVRKMVLKTAAWEAYKSNQVRPFLQTDEYIDKLIAEAQSEMNWNKKPEIAHDNIIEADIQAQQDNASEDSVVDDL